MKTVEFFRSPLTLFISLAYFICAVLTVAIGIIWFTDYENDSSIILEIEKYSFSFFMLFCSVIYFLMFVFSRKSERVFEKTMITLKVESALEIAYVVYTAVILGLLLLAADMALFANSFIFLPAVIINAAAMAVINIVFVAVCVILAVDITRNIAKILFAGAVKKNLSEEKFRSKSSLFLSIMNFVFFSTAVTFALITALLSRNLTGIITAVFISLIALPRFLSGILTYKYNTIKSKES